MSPLRSAQLKHALSRYSDGYAMQHGRTPLFTVSHRGNVKAIRMLLAAGAKVNLADMVSNSACTALHLGFWAQGRYRKS